MDEMDKMRKKIVGQARKLDRAAFDILRWGATDSKEDVYTIPARFVRELGEQRAELHELINKLDVLRDREELRNSKYFRQAEQRRLDEELGLREPCLTMYDDSASGWGFDMTGREAVYQPLAAGDEY